MCWWMTARRIIRAFHFARRAMSWSAPRHSSRTAAAGVEEAADGVFLRGLRRGVVVGVIEAEDLDDVFKRPFHEAAEIGAKLGFKGQGARAGPFDRATDPEAGAGGLEERVAAKAAVAKDAVAGLAVCHLEGGLEAKFLEGADLLRGGTFHLFELHPVVEGEDAHRRPVLVPVGRPVDLLQRRVLAERLFDDAALEEELQLFPGGIGRGAAVAADGEGAAGVGIGESRGPGGAVEPAFQEASARSCASIRRS